MHIDLAHVSQQNMHPQPMHTHLHRSSHHPISLQSSHFVLYKNENATHPSDNGECACMLTHPPSFEPAHPNAQCTTIPSSSVGRSSLRVFTRCNWSKRRGTGFSGSGWREDGRVDALESLLNRVIIFSRTCPETTSLPRDSVRGSRLNHLA